MKIDDRIQWEIRRRAFERADFHERRAALMQSTQHTIDAVASVTGLSRPELESIAAEVSASYEAGADKFFSIRQQLILAGSAVVPLIVLVWSIAMQLR